MLEEIAEILGLLVLLFPFTYLFKVILDLRSRVSYLEAKVELYLKLVRICAYECLHQFSEESLNEV